MVALLYVFAALLLVSVTTSYYDQHRTVNNNNKRILNPYNDNREFVGASKNYYIYYSNKAKQIYENIYYSANGEDLNYLNKEYSDKHQLTALLYSLFLGWCGAARFYVGDYILGAIKINLLGLVIGAPLLNAYCYGMGVNYKNPCCGFSLLVLIAIILWWIVDVLYFALNEIPDCNGLTLIPIE